MARSARRTSHSRSLGLRRGPDPYRQGDLDGLCGVYSIVNAVSALCPELDDHQAQSLFRKLVRSLAAYVERPAGMVCSGLDEATLRHLLTVAQYDTERRLKAHLEIRPYRRKPGKQSLPRLWRSLAEQLGPHQVAILSLGGALDHWTVAYAMSDQTMALLDSTDLRSLPKARTTLKPARTRYRLDPREVVFVERVD